MSSSDCNVKELPFYPKYESECLYKDNLKIIWFQPEFSQSHYNYCDKSNGSNACTIICTLVATKCHMGKVEVGIWVPTRVLGTSADIMNE